MLFDNGFVIFSENIILYRCYHKINTEIALKPVLANVHQYVFSELYSIIYHIIN